MEIERGEKWIQGILIDSKLEKPSASFHVDNEVAEGLRGSLALQLR